ncbi:hypothetical protein AK812_SmicGene35396 [Symbiodinium microadriaticum]|uniref:NHR domain-containing protein n=1 Tax=Symbiodinium microadriaticum TaxID=2951 RepID=A0A1Q9CLH8_SYMMI|nr:hypothetical protein AK812_SmicGene35396 [Symbiodinium microadriaticum]
MDAGRKEEPPVQRETGAVKEEAGAVPPEESLTRKRVEPPVIELPSTPRETLLKDGPESKVGRGGGVSYQEQLQGDRRHVFGLVCVGDVTSTWLRMELPVGALENRKGIYSWNPGPMVTYHGTRTGDLHATLELDGAFSIDELVLWQHGYKFTSEAGEMLLSCTVRVFRNESAKGGMAMSAEAIPWRSGRACFVVEILEMRGRGAEGLEIGITDASPVKPIRLKSGDRVQFCLDMGGGIEVYVNDRLQAPSDAAPPPDRFQVLELEIQEWKKHALHFRCWREGAADHPGLRLAEAGSGGKSDSLFSVPAAPQGQDAEKEGGKDFCEICWESIEAEVRHEALRGKKKLWCKQLKMGRKLRLHCADKAEVVDVLKKIRNMFSETEALLGIEL